MFSAALERVEKELGVLYEDGPIDSLRTLSSSQYTPATTLLGKAHSLRFICREQDESWPWKGLGFSLITMRVARDNLRAPAVAASKGCLIKLTESRREGLYSSGPWTTQLEIGRARFHRSGLESPGQNGCWP